MKREPAKNTFEAWNYLWYETTVESPTALAVAFALLGFWNMDGRGRCNPSVESIMDKTKIKSRNTVNRAIEELENSGEWVVVRSKGRKSTQYFPMFVSGARKDLLAFDPDAVLDELEEPAPEDILAEDVIPEIEEESQESASEESMDDTEVQDAPAETSTEVLEPKVRDEKDLQLKNDHRDLVQSRQGTHSIFSVPEGAIEVAILNEGDIDKYGLSNGNPNKVFVSGAQGFEFLDELPCRWVEKYGEAYGEIFTYSSITELYKRLYYPQIEKHVTNIQEYFPVDTAMWILGDVGFVPSEKAVKALIYGTRLDSKMRELQRRYKATLEGRRLTYEQNIEGHFSPTRKQYSQNF
jgi:hypothetical protein